MSSMRSRQARRWFTPRKVYNDAQRRRTDAKLLQAGGELVTRELLALIVIHRVEHLHHRPGPCLKLLLDLPHDFIDLRRAREGRHAKRMLCCFATREHDNGSVLTDAASQSLNKELWTF